MGERTGQLHVVEIASLLRELTAGLIASDDLDEAMEVLVATTAQAVPGESWCGITLIRAGAPTTQAASSPLTARVDDIQYKIGDGPALTAIRTREMVVVGDLAGEARWPQWREAAADDGISGVLSMPLDIDDHVIGALNLYTSESNAFSPDVQLAAMLVAEHAGLLLAAVLDRGRLAGLAADLSEALASGDTVNRAIGIVMAQRGCRAEEALQVLRQASMNLHVPLHDVADRLVNAIGSRSA
ncbi:GAF and ANTAR domain-containing protein [Planosporangium flavigriseum]|uniref:Transcriptional regulator n=1 Tax=Planosporangium flavigriseum TaxID=373681 RepID=A0A8J3PLU0_9ACTN|nr:GAF and ANTAR domain-containing protein [Planosporangium flavigriseum]NJC66402.1 GAF and ANTAR domain-containing protein [Planosporangium flavigriseum]GIG74192.1 transcriptional regulator [Planosporangium flavigriseum]